MTPYMRLRVIFAAILLVIGVGFACLPDAWIEMAFGFDPDGGNDAVEILLAAVPITAGLALGAEVLLRRRRLAAGWQR